MLGPVLLGREQALLGALAGGDRPGDRVQAGAAAFELHVRLRRRADEADVAELEQEQVRRRVDPAQRAVERDGGRVGAADRPLREDDLERVAGDDVLLGADARAARARRGSARARWDGSRAVRSPGSSTCPASAVAISAGSPASTSATLDTWSIRDEHVGDDEAALRQVGPLVRKRHGRLELRDVVVAEIADDRRRRLLGLLEGDEPRAAADEGVPAEPSLLDRLEQEARGSRAGAGAGRHRAG